MSDIIQPCPAVDAGLLTAWAPYATGLISDAMGRRGAMDAGIRPVTAVTRFCGVAFTVETRPGDNLFLLKALGMVVPGCVLVVNGFGDGNAAVWGGHMGSGLKARGGVAAIIDGCVRDRDELNSLQVPTFARGIRPNGPQKDGPGRINHPIPCGGLVVYPGDLVVGDGDGVVVIPQGQATDLLLAMPKAAQQDAVNGETIAEGRVPAWVEERLASKGWL